MVRWRVFNKEIDVCKVIWLAIIMKRSVNPTVTKQIRLLSKDQINTW